MSNFEIPSPILSSPFEEPKEHWWLIAFPGGVFVTTLLALNFLGDGLRDAWDVKGK